MGKALADNSTRIANWLAGTILVLVPFHAFLTVWGSSLVGHYTALRLWDEIVLLLLVMIALGWLVRDNVLRGDLFRSLLFRLIIAYSLLTIALGLLALAKHEVTPKALGYGLIVNLRFLAFFVAVGLLAQKSDWLATRWIKLLLWPAAIVVGFALLQFTVLPHNFLAHFGYNSETNIAPIETINHNSQYIRVQSTLRGANPLGAYLVIVSATLSSLFFVFKKQRRAIMAAGIATAWALLFSGSRSAWIGAFLALLIVLWFQLDSKRARWRAVAITGAVLLVAAAVLLTLRNDPRVQNTLWHTQANSQVASSSNSGHLSALKYGMQDVVHEPFGRGPGTAGPESVYNDGHPVRIAENYFVQIAQETGWAGLLLLLGIFYVVSMELFRRRRVPLALALLASLVGITIINLLSHAWIDDTLAYIWWGLMGVAAILGIEANKYETPQAPQGTKKRS